MKNQEMRNPAEITQPQKLFDSTEREFNQALHDQRQLLKERALATLYMNEPKIPALEAVKDDEGKLQYHLIPPHAMEEIVRVLMWGAENYGERNWLKKGGFPFNRIWDALMRHCWAFFKGETHDKQTGLHHLAHAATNCLFLVEYFFLKTGNDDRPKYECEATNEDSNLTSTAD